MTHEKLIAHISAFLKERDEATRDDERDDDERKASAQCIVRVVFKALKEHSGEMMQAGADASPMWQTDNAGTYAIAVNDVADIFIDMLRASPLATKESAE